MTAPGMSALDIKIALQSGHRVSPSRPETFPGVWVGQKAEGSRWTVQQLARIEREREEATKIKSSFGRSVVAHLRDPEALEAFPVPFPEGAVDCPVLARSRDKRLVLIVAPGGDKMWVNAKC